MSETSCRMNSEGRDIVDGRKKRVYLESAAYQKNVFPKLNKHKKSYLIM